jgi:hypothetical protein
MIPRVTIRRLLLCLPLLLVGAAVNVLVALGSFAFQAPAACVESTHPVEAWPAPVPADWPAPRLEEIRRYNIVTFRSVASGERVARELSGLDAPACEVSLFELGRPFRCLGMYATIDRRPRPAASSAGPTGRPIEITHGVLDIPPGLQLLTGLPWMPVRPIAAGFAANSALYAAAVGAMLWIPVRVRRFERRRRGLCEGCGYPSGASPVCTECGAPLPRGRAIAARREVPPRPDRPR